MKASQNLMSLSQLINMFSIFVVGTIAFPFFYLLSSVPDFKFKQGLQLAIFLLGLFSYEFVIIKLSLYYLTKATKKFAELIERKPKLIYLAIVFVLGISYIVVDYIKEHSWLILLRDVIMMCLIAVSLPVVTGYFEKKRSSKNANK